MNFAILHPEVQDYINSNLKEDPTSLILKGLKFTGVSVHEIVEQIEAKKRCQTKLPKWFNTQDIYYPNKLNIEQTSSELTSQFKATLINGTSILDLTGGFGIDSYYFAEKFKYVTHCEINTDLSQIVRHNFEQLDVKNIETISTDGIEFIKHSEKHYDWIYIDPSRRNDVKGKVFFLKDCSPNVPNELETLLQNSNNILIKTAPLLDISAGLNELKSVKTILVVAVENEVKELLWILEKGYNSKISIETINLKPQKNEVFKFDFSDELGIEVPYSMPLDYLYEPNSAILKAGGFNSIAAMMDVFKLHKHSHLYTSKDLIEFPGRSFKILKAVLYNKKTIKGLNIQKANITTRNFPETVENIRKKYAIKDGGSVYLFFTINFVGEKYVLECSKIN